MKIGKEKIEILEVSESKTAGILNIEKSISLADREIDLFLPMDDGNQMGHIIIQPLAEMPSEDYTSHQEDEYLYLIKGELIVKTREKQWNVKIGEVNLIPKGVEHMLFNCSTEVGEFVFFNKR